MKVINGYQVIGYNDNYHGGNKALDIYQSLKRAVLERDFLQKKPVICSACGEPERYGLIKVRIFLEEDE